MADSWSSVVTITRPIRKLIWPDRRRTRISLGFVAEILFATSAVRPRADVAYCIHALSRRLAKTRNWTVGLIMIMMMTKFM